MSCETKKNLAPPMVGARFERLVVLEAAERTPTPTRAKPNKTGRQWLCQCDCGQKVVVRDSRLRYGVTRSCGCLVKDLIVARNTVHGHGKRGESPTYLVWCHVISRCENPKVPGFENYGGRGITMCRRWRQGEDGKSGFECFLADVGERPSRSHSLDRFPNNDGNYEPGNVRWATRAEQSRNTRQNHWLEMDGRRMVLKDWAREHGISAPTLRYRLAKGHSLRDALTTPPGRIDKRFR